MKYTSFLAAFAILFSVAIATPAEAYFAHQFIVPTSKRVRYVPSGLTHADGWPKWIGRLDEETRRRLLANWDGSMSKEAYLESLGFSEDPAKWPTWIGRPLFSR